MKNRFFKLIAENPLCLFEIVFYNLKTLLLKLSGKKTIVYNIQMDYFYNTFESIYMELLKDKRIVVFFSYYEGLQKLYNYLITIIPPKRLISSKISPFVYFDMFITAEINGPDFPVSFFPTHKIQLYHGIGVAPLHKKSSVLSNFNTHFALGKQLVEFIETLPNKKKGQNEYDEVGFPKLDAICNPDPVAERKLKNLYNITNQFVIIYAPHWNPNGSLHVLSLDMIANLTELENVIILIKVHNFLYTRFKEERWQEKLEQFANVYENVFYVTRPNTQEIFPLGDLLITDALTTAGFEFSLTLKPVFAFSSPGWFKENPHCAVEREIVNTSICFSNADEVYEYTRQLVAGEPEMIDKIKVQKKKQKELIEKFLFNPGTATQAAVKVIYRELNLEK
jgi:hypothetical protein